MEFLTDTHIKHLKHDLAETYKEEIKAKVKKFKHQFKDKGYLILLPNNYIEERLTDLKIVHENKYEQEQIRNICEEIAIERYIESIRQHIKSTKIEGKYQHKYSLHRMYNRQNELMYIVLPYELAKGLPQQFELERATNLCEYKYIDGSRVRNVKINVENARDEIKRIFLGVLLHTNWNIEQPNNKTFTFLWNSSHKPTIKNGYLSLLPIDDATVSLFDEAGQTIDPEYYVPLDLFEMCKDRVILD
jgi:hypothetical protein